MFFKFIMRCKLIDYIFFWVAVAFNLFHDNDHLISIKLLNQSSIIKIILQDFLCGYSGVFVLCGKKNFFLFQLLLVVYRLLFLDNFFLKINLILFLTIFFWIFCWTAMKFLLKCLGGIWHYVICNCGPAYLIFLNKVLLLNAL